MNPLFSSSTESLLQIAREIKDIDAALVKNLGINTTQTTFESTDERINQVKKDVLNNNTEAAFTLLSQMQTSYDHFKSIAKELSSQHEALKKVLDCYDQNLFQFQIKLHSKTYEHPSIQRISLEEARENKIQKLLSSSRGVEKTPISEIEMLMDELVEFLPFFTLAQLNQFSDHFLPDLLKYSGQLAKKQCDLAYALGQAHVKHAINHSLTINDMSWRLGMAYLAKAVTIATENKWECNLYYQAIHHLILNLALRSPLFEEQQNTVPNSAEKFEKLILAMHKLERFCASISDRELIQKCYLKTLKILNSIQYDKFSLFNMCSELIKARLPVIPAENRAKVLKVNDEDVWGLRKLFSETAELEEVKTPEGNVVPFSNFCTKRYIDKINAVRRLFPSTGIRKAQETGTKLLIDFLAMVIDDAIAIVGPPPCGYDFRALGSIGKEEGCPYSDIEAMIIIQDEKYRPYFQHLARMMELLIISLDESPTLKDISSVFTCLPGEPKLGLHLDRGANPANIEDLIRTPLNMAQHQISSVSEDFFTSYDHATRKSMSLHQNDPSLFQSFQDLVTSNSEKARKKRGLILLKTRLKDFHERWEKEKYITEIDLKTQYIQLLQYVLSDLSIYFGIKEGNSLDILDQLEHVFDPCTRSLLKFTVEQLHEMRIRLHQFYKYPKTEMNLYDGKRIENVYGASQDDDLILRGSYQLVLRPLYLILSLALEEGDFKLKNLSDKMANWCSNFVHANPETNEVKKFEHFLKEINLVELSCHSIFETNDPVLAYFQRIAVDYAFRVLCKLHTQESIAQLLQLCQQLLQRPNVYRSRMSENIKENLSSIETKIAEISIAENLRASWQKQVDSIKQDLDLIEVERHFNSVLELEEIRKSSMNGNYYEVKVDIWKEAQHKITKFVDINTLYCTQEFVSQYLQLSQQLLQIYQKFSTRKGEEYIRQKDNLRFILIHLLNIPRIIEYKAWYPDDFKQIDSIKKEIKKIEKSKFNFFNF